MSSYRVHREIFWMLRCSLLFAWICTAGGAVLLGWMLEYLAEYPGALEVLARVFSG